MRTRNLLKFIRNLREDKLCLEECVNLLLDLQLNRGPIIETITVIQHEKPLLFSWLKSRLSFRPGLLMMLDVRMEYEEAVNRLSGNSEHPTNIESVHLI